MQSPGHIQIRDALLRDLRSLQGGINTNPDSDWYLRASATASAISGLYDYQAWMLKQFFPDSADREYLLAHAALRNLAPLPATFAEGTITLVGNVGTAIPAGTALKRPDGVAYHTSAAAVVSAVGSIAVPAQATEAGALGNADPGTALTVTSAPLGIDVAAFVVAMPGGADTETDEHLLMRLLDLIRRPPAGGNAADFRRWAMEVPGIDAAFVFPARRAPGTVDVVVIGGAGRPSDATLDAVRAHINELRPAGLRDVLVTAPTIRAIDHTVAISVTSGNIEDYRESIALALADWLAPLLPGAPWIKSQAEVVISSVPGIADRNLITPAVNINPVITDISMEWLRLGVVTVVAL